MNKRTGIMTILGFLLLLIIVGGSGTTMDLVNTQELNISDNERIDISYISESVRLLPGDSDKLIIKEYMNKDNSYYFARISQNGNTTSIKHGNRKPMSMLRCEVEIYIPVQHLDRLSVTTVSGAVHLDTDIEANAVSLGTTSGSAKAGNIKADAIDLGTTSGAIKVNGAYGKTNATAVSGSISIYDASGSGSLKTTSGSIRASYNNIDDRIRLESVSGSLKLELPQSAGFRFYASSTTGSVKTHFDNQLDKSSHKANGSVNGGGPDVDMSTISGSIKAEMR